MRMIDWWGLFSNALWVIGLAVGLAALSMASYQARVDGIRLRKRLNEASFQMPFALGIVLFCLGLLFSSRVWWAWFLWGLSAAASAGLAIWLWKRERTDREAAGNPSAPLQADAAEHLGGESRRNS